MLAGSSRARSRRSAAIEGKRSAAAFSALVVGAVAWPIRQNWRARPRDGFPLSYFPMFTVDRSKRCKVTHLVGVRADGERVVIPYHCGGAGGLNQVRRQLRRIAREGDPDELCRLVAQRVARRSGAGLEGLASVQLITGEYCLEAFGRGERELLREQVHASHDVQVAG